jgi:hypothetical protein
MPNNIGSAKVLQTTVYEEILPKENEFYEVFFWTM